MHIAVTMTRPYDPDLHAYVEISVRADDERNVLGAWAHTTSTGDTLARMFPKDGAKPIGEAWDEALEYATAHGLGVIYLDDPGNLFAVEDFGLKPI
jgi:hypothetical protein